MCGIPSTNPSPIYQEDKYKLNELCLQSFVEAFKDVKPKMIFLNDFCDMRYGDMIRSIVPFEFQVEPSEIGINETMLRSYELAYAQDDDILFQECDYLYRPGTGKALIEGLNELTLVSPYDHLNFYVDKTLHSNQVILELVGDTHWRSTERNTMTFAIKNRVFKDNYKRFKHWGYLDGDIWYEMLGKGYPMFVPIPSFATHMITDFMAPSVDWKSLYEV